MRKKEPTFLCFCPLNLLVCTSFLAFHQWRLMKGSGTVWSENIGNLCSSSLLFDKVQQATLWSHKLQGRHRHQDISHRACSYETCYLQRPSASYAWVTFTLVWICPSKLLWGVDCCERTVWLPANEFGTRPTASVRLTKPSECCVIFKDFKCDALKSSLQYKILDVKSGKYILAVVQL